MEETLIEPEKPATDKNDEGAIYVDCIRVVEGGNIRRFESLVTKFDIVQFELSHEVSKPLLFFAIEHNDEPFVKVLLEMEVPLDRSYSVSRTGDSEMNVLIFSLILFRSWFPWRRCPTLR